MTTGWVVGMLLTCLSADAVLNGVIRDLGFSLIAADDYERAAFVILDTSGSPRLIEWPRTHRFRSMVWKGPLPANVVGIVHTHPQHMPLPSDDDVKTAMRLKMPVVALTPRSLCTATASGEVRCAPLSRQ